MARPGLELPAVAGAVEHEEPDGRKADAAAPGEGEAAMRFLDKIVEIALPAMIEVAEEDQPAAIVHEDPVSKVDRSHAPEITIRRGGAHDQTQAQMSRPEERHAQNASSPCGSGRCGPRAEPSR